jgi:hypothetical protein
MSLFDHMRMYETMDLYGKDVGITLPSVKVVWLGDRVSGSFVHLTQEIYLFSEASRGPRLPCFSLKNPVIGDRQDDVLMILGQNSKSEVWPFLGFFDPLGSQNQK